MTVVAESTKRIRIGLIDCFGFYTLIKLLETTSKTTLKKLRGSDDTVTVIPPADYAERFLTATEAYFIDGQLRFRVVAFEGGLTRPRSTGEVDSSAGSRRFGEARVSVVAIFSLFSLFCSFVFIVSSRICVLQSHFHLAYHPQSLCDRLSEK